MSAFAYLTVIGLIGTAWCAAIGSVRTMPRRVSVGTHELRISLSGSGSPTVVLDTFGVAQLEIWSEVQPRIAAFARCVSFDHAGAWGSEPGPRPRDARRLAHELRAALAAAQVPPPYLLVGYSMGGPYSRVFADLYPAEVAGLVLVDPTQEAFLDWLVTWWPDANRIPERDRAERTERGCVAESLDQARAAALPPVPVTLISAVKPHDVFTHRVMPRWLEEHRRWLANIPGARHVVTVRSGHDLLWTEPELVIEAIRSTMVLARRE